MVPLERYMSAGAIFLFVFFYTICCIKFVVIYWKHPATFSKKMKFTLLLFLCDDAV